MKNNYSLSKKKNKYNIYILGFYIIVLDQDYRQLLNNNKSRQMAASSARNNIIRILELLSSDHCLPGEEQYIHFSAQA